MTRKELYEQIRRIPLADTANVFAVGKTENFSITYNISIPDEFLGGEDGRVYITLVTPTSHDNTYITRNKRHMLASLEEVGFHVSGEIFINWDTPIEKVTWDAFRQSIYIIFNPLTKTE